MINPTASPPSADHTRCEFTRMVSSTKTVPAGNNDVTCAHHAGHQQRVLADDDGPATGDGVCRMRRAGVAIQIFGQPVAGAGRGGDQDAIHHRPLATDRGDQQQEHRQRQQLQGFFEERIHRV